MHPFKDFYRPGDGIFSWLMAAMMTCIVSFLLVAFFVGVPSFIGYALYHWNDADAWSKPYHACLARRWVGKTYQCVERDTAWHIDFGQTHYTIIKDKE